MAWAIHHQQLRVVRPRCHVEWPGLSTTNNFAWSDPAATLDSIRGNQRDKRQSDQRDAQHKGNNRNRAQEAAPGCRAPFGRPKRGDTPDAVKTAHQEDNQVCPEQLPSQSRGGPPQAKGQNEHPHPKSHRHQQPDHESQKPPDTDTTHRHQLYPSKNESANQEIKEQRNKADNPVREREQAEKQVGWHVPQGISRLSTSVFFRILCMVNLPQDGQAPSRLGSPAAR